MEAHSSSFHFWFKVMVEIERLACLSAHSAELIKCDCVRPAFSPGTTRLILRGTPAFDRCAGLHCLRR